MENIKQDEIIYSTENETKNTIENLLNKEDLEKLESPLEKLLENQALKFKEKLDREINKNMSGAMKGKFEALRAMSKKELTAEELFNIDMKIKILTNRLIYESAGLFDRELDVCSEEESLRENVSSYDQAGVFPRQIMAINEDLALVEQGTIRYGRDFGRSDSYPFMVTQRTPTVENKLSRINNNLEKKGMLKFYKPSLSRENFARNILGFNGAGGLSEGRDPATNYYHKLIRKQDYYNRRLNNSFAEFVNEEYEKGFKDYLDKNGYKDGDNTTYSIDELLKHYSGNDNLEKDPNGEGVKFSYYNSNTGETAQYFINRFDERYCDGVTHL
jgi:hypothetical protein